MRRHTAHEGEAPGLPACAAASVRLRLSATDRMLLVLRWTLTLVGAVVVLWVGSAFLATPASAAAVPVTVASAGVRSHSTARYAVTVQAQQPPSFGNQPHCHSE